MNIRAYILATGLCLGTLPLASPLVRADEVSDLDLLSSATDDAKAGLALAREQTDLGDLTGAMATLERLLINHPDANEAQLLHASLLCRLDDRSGASSEFSALRKRDFRGQAWKDANAPCAVAWPAAPAAPAETRDDAGKGTGDAAKSTPRRRPPGFD